MRIGDDSSIWDSVHIRQNTKIGYSCIVGEKTHISYNVVVGNFVKINAFVYICTGVAIDDGVMISAGVIFTNDLYPRASDTAITQLRSSLPDENTLATRVCRGSTIGSRSVIGPGLTIGQFAMIGFGSVVTRDVGDFELWYGTPAKFVGYVCKCGHPFPRGDGANLTMLKRCFNCQLEYQYNGENLICITTNPILG